jgi:hypothetical protein
MTTSKTVIWISSVIAAVAIGWFAAMEVNRGPALRNEEDAYERFSNAFTITDSMERSEVVARLVRRLTPETLPGAVRAFYDDQKDIYNNDLRMLLWYWAREDPRGMLAEIQGWPEVRSQRIAAGQAVYWVLEQEGYPAARALFDQLPNHQRDQALAYLVLAYLESGETADLVSLIESYNFKDERDFAAGIVVAQIYRLNGPEALTRWVESLPDGPGTSNDLKSVAFRATQTQLMNHDEFAFLESWLERVDEQRWTRGGGWRTIGVHLAKRDPLRALAWAEALPPERNREEVLGETIRAYASHDRDGALSWMRTQEPSPELDPGAARLSFEFADRDPAVALEMLERINDPDVFEKARKMLTVKWRAAPESVQEVLMKRLEEIPEPPLTTDAETSAGQQS